jgi:hypothetical protein
MPGQSGRARGGHGRGQEFFFKNPNLFFSPIFCVVFSQSQMDIKPQYEVAYSRVVTARHATICQRMKSTDVVFREKKQN